MSIVLALVFPLDASFGPTRFDFQRYGVANVGYANVEPAYPTSAYAATLRSELDSLMLDCGQAGWDGYGAEPVTLDAIHAAERFIRCLPAGVPPPEVSADRDGCVTFEWKKSARRTLLVSVRPGYAVDYAALIGTEKAYGDAPLFDELPERLLSLIRSVVAA